jgi:type IV secretion system protein VirB8
MLSKKQSPKIDEAVSRAVNYEIAVSDLARRSERRAWMVASASIMMSLILAGGYFYMLPLKEQVPYLVLADAYTGTSSLSRLTDDVVNRHITANEAINRSNITHFILARESYDVNMILLRDWTTVLTMAAPNVATGYTQLHSPQNPTSPYKTYGRDRAIRVKVLSIVLIPSDTAGMPPAGATVRFQRTVYNKQTGASTPLDSKIATLSFVYKPNLKMDDQNRVENPLGFQVTAYRVDNDYDTPPPAEVQGADTTAPSAPTAPAGENQAAANGAQAAGTDPTSGVAPTAMPQPPIPAEGVVPPPPAYAAPTGAPVNAPVAPQAAAPVPQNAANGGRRR